MPIKINVPAANTAVLNNGLLTKIYHVFFGAITKRINDLSESTITQGSETIPGTVKQQEIFAYNLSGDKNVILPQAGKVKGVIFYICNKTTIGSFNLTISGDKKINGLLSLTLAPFVCKGFISLGDEWVTV